MFRGIKPDAGQWRRVNVRIAGTRHVPPRMENVVAMMTEWEETYARRDMQGAELFSLAAWMLFAFETIHPFSDGNGRVGRLLLNLHFLKHNWPPIHVLPPDRNRYLKSLDRGHAGNLTDLEEFFQVAMGRSLLELLDQVGTREDDLKPLERLAGKSRYSAKYLGLRASQERIPALKISGDWRTSERAIRVYQDLLGR
ncbi:MAG: Fic family protein [Thermoplasmata archaeon]